MTEEERTIDVEREAGTEGDTGGREAFDAGTEVRTASDEGAAVYSGDEVTTAFNDRVERAPTDGVGRVTGLTHAEGGGLVLTVETVEGEHAAFALEDPADGHLDGRLRRLVHELGVAGGDVRGSLVPLTTVDGRPAIDWERVPEAPTNPSASVEPAPATDRAEPAGDSLTATLRKRAGGLALWEALLAVGGGGLAGVLLLLGGASGATTVAGAALLQVLVAAVLVLRGRLLGSRTLEE